MAQHRMPLRKHTLSAPMALSDEQLRAFSDKTHAALADLRRLEAESQRGFYTEAQRDMLRKRLQRATKHYETMKEQLEDMLYARGVRAPSAAAAAAPPPPPPQSPSPPPAPPPPSPAAIKAEESKAKPSFLRNAVSKLNRYSDEKLGLLDDEISDELERARRARHEDDVNAHAIANGLGHLPEYRVQSRDELLGDVAGDIASGAGRAASSVAGALLPNRETLSEAGKAAMRRAADLSGALYGVLPSAVSVRDSAQRVAGAASGALDTGRRIAGSLKAKHDAMVKRQESQSDEEAMERTRKEYEENKRKYEDQRLESSAEAAAELGRLAHAAVMKEARDEKQRFDEEMQKLEEEANREREKRLKKEQDKDEKRRRHLEELHRQEEAARIKREEEEQERENEEMGHMPAHVPLLAAEDQPVHLNSYLPPPPEEPPAPAIVSVPFHLRPPPPPPAPQPEPNTLTLLQDEPNTPAVNRPGKREKKSGALAQFSDRQQRQLHAADVARRAHEEDEKRRKAEEAVQIERQRAEEARERAAHQEALAADSERKAILAQHDYAQIREGEGGERVPVASPSKDPYDQRRRVNIQRVRIPIEQEELVHVKPEQPPAPSFPPESPPQMSAPPPSPPPTVHHITPPEPYQLTLTQPHYESPPPPRHTEEESMAIVPPESPPTHTEPIAEPAPPTHKRKNSTPHASIKPAESPPLPPPPPSTTTTAAAAASAAATRGPAPRAAKRSRVPSKRAAAGDRNASSASRYHHVDWKAKEKEYTDIIERMARDLHAERSKLESSPAVARRAPTAPIAVAATAATPTPVQSFHHIVTVPQRYRQQWSDMPEDPADDMHAPRVVTTTTTTTY